VDSNESGDAAANPETTIPAAPAINLLRLILNNGIVLVFMKAFPLCYFGSSRFYGVNIGVVRA